MAWLIPNLKYLNASGVLVQTNVIKKKKNFNYKLPASEDEIRNLKTKNLLSPQTFSQ